MGWLTKRETSLSLRNAIWVIMANRSGVGGKHILDAKCQYIRYDKNDGKDQGLFPRPANEEEHNDEHHENSGARKSDIRKQLVKHPAVIDAPNAVGDVVVKLSIIHRC